MPNITAVNPSSDAKIQSATEIMYQVFDGLRGNHPIKFEDSDLSSLKLHRRYLSLPSMPKQLISNGQAVEIDLQYSTSLMV